MSRLDAVGIPVIHGGEDVKLGLLDVAVVGERYQSGNNCVLNIHVDNADAELARLSEFSNVVMPITTMGPYRLFQVEDSEGNVVEFYSDSASRSQS